MARKGALAARVERYIDFDCLRFQDVQPPAPSGLLVINLPYGERIGSDNGDLRALYEDVGDTLKKKFAGWRAAILAANDSPHKAIGLKPDRTVPLVNGSIDCRLLIYEIYAGSRRNGA